jgi:septal ring factor EnvC (AmiA/AmiB activator)
MDTTLMSELEYINILPDMELDDSSFLKGSFVNSAAARAEKSQEDAAIKAANEEQQKKISELEKQLETQQKQINDLTNQ